MRPVRPGKLLDEKDHFPKGRRVEPPSARRVAYGKPRRRLALGLRVPLPLRIMVRGPDRERRDTCVKRRCVQQGIVIQPGVTRIGLKRCSLSHRIASRARSQITDHRERRLELGDLYRDRVQLLKHVGDGKRCAFSSEHRHPALQFQRGLDRPRANLLDRE